MISRPELGSGGGAGLQCSLENDPKAAATLPRAQLYPHLAREPTLTQPRLSGAALRQSPFKSTQPSPLADQGRTWNGRSWGPCPSHSEGLNLDLLQHTRRPSQTLVRDREVGGRGGKAPGLSTRGWGGEKRKGLQGEKGTQSWERDPRFLLPALQLTRWGPLTQSPPRLLASVPPSISRGDGGFAGSVLHGELNDFMCSSALGQHLAPGKHPRERL